jgi:hypothetical protein
MKKQILTLLTIAGLTFSSHAVQYDLTGVACTEIAGSSNPTSAEIAAALGITVAQLGSSIYKFDAPSTESGNTGLFDVSISPSVPPPGAQTATITVNGSVTIGYILVKDGTGGSCVWTVNQAFVAGDTILVDNEDLFLPNNPDTVGAISHVDIFGGGTNVPDAGSGLMLLGMGLMALEGVRRRFAK